MQSDHWLHTSPFHILKPHWHSIDIELDLHSFPRDTMVLCQRLKDALKGLGVIKQTGQHPPSSIFKQISCLNRPTSLPDFHPHPQIPKFSITDYPHTYLSAWKNVSAE